MPAQSGTRSSENWTTLCMHGALDRQTGRQVLRSIPSAAEVERVFWSKATEEPVAFLKKSIVYSPHDTSLRTGEKITGLAKVLIVCAEQSPSDDSSFGLALDFPAVMMFSRPKYDTFVCLCTLIHYLCTSDHLRLRVARRPTLLCSNCRCTGSSNATHTTVIQ